MRNDDKNLVTRRASTQELAANFRDDIDFFRELLAGRTPKRAQVRLLSTALRRMFLQQRELKRVSEVRVQDFTIRAPDFSGFVGLENSGLKFFAGGGGSAFGIEQQAASLAAGNKPLSPKGYSPGDKFEFKIGDFLSQKTLLWRNTWFKRSEAIEFAANKLGGAHTGKLSNKKDRILKDLCSHGHISISDGVPTISVSLPSSDLVEGRPKLRGDAIDYILFEAISALDFLVQSPKTMELIEYIENELEP